MTPPELEHAQTAKDKNEPDPCLFNFEIASDIPSDNIEMSEHSIVDA